MKMMLLAKMFQKTMFSEQRWVTESSTNTDIVLLLIRKQRMVSLYLLYVMTTAV